uniref:Gag-pol polyprotein n=1 Tax=Solanum tuberosum TaxID=4113 RepID=M1DQG7_SOLTU
MSSVSLAFVDPIHVLKGPCDLSFTFANGSPKLTGTASGINETSTMIVDARERMSKFVLGVSKIVVKKCRTDMLINDMDISRLMVHAQQIEEEKLRGRSREKKKARAGDGNFSH